eukprot:gnl/Dysnectes_brevis/13428_a31059_108.p1 GENE.gnl/Dysnectes_brevis/13428_a31059_108~~gnl/Dysnectes_brevis/13428_a31059_108.p1  ORF type:complete len:231 (-),score=39.39 gnl/Dysnectes_brevis/13428_a31059_108:47-739(-)
MILIDTPCSQCHETYALDERDFHNTEVACPRCARMMPRCQLDAHFQMFPNHRNQSSSHAPVQPCVDDGAPTFTAGSSDTDFSLESGGCVARKTAFSLHCAKTASCVTPGIHCWKLDLVRLTSGIASIGVAHPAECGALPGRGTMPQSVGLDSDDGNCFVGGQAAERPAWSFGAGDTLTVRLDTRLGDVTFLKDGEVPYTHVLPSRDSPYSLAVGLYGRHDQVRITSYWLE